MRLTVLLLLIGAAVSAPAEPGPNVVQSSPNANIGKPGQAGAAVAAGVGDKSPVASAVHTTDDEDESRLEPVPGSEDPVHPMGETVIRTLGRETAHKPSDHDLLMRDRAQEVARKQLQEEHTNMTKSKIDTPTTTGGPATPTKEFPAGKADTDGAGVSDTAPTTASDPVGNTTAEITSYTNTNAIPSKPLADGEKNVLGKPSPSMDKDMPTKVAPKNEEPGTMGPPAVERVSETDSMKKVDAPVLYSLESDMMAGGSPDTSTAKETSVVSTMTKPDASVIPDAKILDRNSMKGAENMPMKSAVAPEIVPSRYSTAVLIEPMGSTNSMENVEDEGSVIGQTVQPAGPVSLKSATFTVRGASRQFGLVPHILPFSEELLLQSNEVKSYDGYKVYRANVDSRMMESFLYELANDESQNVILWNEPRVDNNVTFIASPATAQKVEETLKKQDLKYAVLTDNLKTWIDAERKELNPSLFLQQPNIENFKLDTYHRLDEIYSYLDLLASEYPALVRPVTLGTTYENNTIRGVVVSTGGSKRAIYIDAGTHAREWVSIASALYLLSNIVTKANSDPEVTALLDKFDFHFVPVVNVDGYKYTWNGDRLWRKNRVRFQGFYWCAGVDPNRNFGFHWGGEGASANPCAQDYRGPSEFSENESRAIRDYITPLKNNLSLYLSLHSYGQYLLLPYGTGPSLVSAQHSDLMAAGSAFRDAIYKKSNHMYRVGGSKQTLYPASGLSNDWAHKLGVKYAFVAELRDQGSYGFLLPASQIVPTAEELFEGVKALGKKIE